MTNKIPIVTNAAAPYIGTHSQALLVGDLVFTTSQAGRDKSGILKEGLEAHPVEQMQGIFLYREAHLFGPRLLVRQIHKELNGDKNEFLDPSLQERFHHLPDAFLVFVRQLKKIKISFNTCKDRDKLLEH